MSRHCAIYARYSSDLQRESSIEDQVRRCREYAQRQGWAVVEDYVVADRAVSAAAMSGRDGLHRLIADAKRKPPPFDCLLVEDTSRLARDLSDSLRVTATFKFHGVSTVAVTQGIDTAQDNSRQLLTLHGMVDEQFLVGLRQKVHRGQEGRVLQGLNPGGRCYGYRNVPIEDPTRQGKYGRSAVIGVRQEIIEEEAAVVRRIFEMYASGAGLSQIAKQFNQEGVPAPKPASNRLRAVWSRYSIREMLHNERYRGVVVWNRTRKMRDPETGRKISRPRPESDWNRKEVPALRIVSEELWRAAHEQNARVNALGITRLGGRCRTQRSRTYLFSGVLACGECGSSVVIISGGGKRGYVKYGCHARKHTGVCDNDLLIRQDRLEEQLLAAIEERVLTPVMIDYAVCRCREELKRRLAEMQRHGVGDPDNLKRRREEVQAKQRHVIEAIEAGGEIPALARRLRELEDEAGRLDRALVGARPLRLDVSEDEIREQVTKTLLSLRQALSDEDLIRAKTAIMKHVGRLVLTPVVRDGRQVYRVSGSVGVPVEKSGMLLVARDGIEPPTPAFSGLLIDTVERFRVGVSD